MKWAIVKQPFPKGGLGIRDLITFNEALFGKCSLRFIKEEGKLCRAMIKAKYGAEGLHWIPSKYNGSYRVGLWKFITRGWDRLFSRIIFEVGDGSTFFWHSRWCDGVGLTNRYPSLFVLAGDRDARVYDSLDHSPSLVLWSPVFFFHPTFS